MIRQGTAVNDHPNHVYTISTLETLLEIAQGTYYPRTFCGGFQNVPRDWEWLNNRQIIDLLLYMVSDNCMQSWGNTVFVESILFEATQENTRGLENWNSWRMQYLFLIALS